MKSLLSRLFATLGLACLMILSMGTVACAPTIDRLGTTGAGIVAAVPVSPVAVADRVVLDEKLLTGLELAYKAARLLAEATTDFGLIRGEVAGKVAQLDTAAFAALGVARTAYRAGNADSYAAALREGEASIAALLALAGK